ncbi:MAG: hypothetical protein ACKOUR_05210, partial [Planctomycetota bacterium]
YSNLLAGLRAADHNGPLIPSPYSPTGKKETRLAMATITLFSCGGEGSSQQRKRDSQKKAPLKGWA